MGAPPRIRTRRAACLLGLVACGPAAACTASLPQTCTTSFSSLVRFDAPITLAKQSDIAFGTVLAGRAATYTISPDGTVSTGDGQWLAGPTSGGRILITGSTAQAINVNTSNYVADGGVSLVNATCAYGNAAAVSCAMNGVAAPGSGGKLLRIGIDAIVGSPRAAGTGAAPSMVVYVVYQ